MASNPPQDFKHHTKYDPPFHFVLAPILMINFIGCIVHCFRHPSLIAGWYIVLAFGAVLALGMIRRYSLKVQDRLIRLEERMRLSALLPVAQHQVLNTLDEKQLVALRFASDAEAPALAESAASQNLKPKAIKAAIQNWRPDYFRV